MFFVKFFRRKNFNSAFGTFSFARSEAESLVAYSIYVRRSTAFRLPTGREFESLQLPYILPVFRDLLTHSYFLSKKIFMKWGFFGIWDIYSQQSSVFRRNGKKSFRFIFFIFWRKISILSKPTQVCQSVYKNIIVWINFLSAFQWEDFWLSWFLRGQKKTNLLRKCCCSSILFCDSLDGTPRSSNSFEFPECRKWLSSKPTGLISSSKPQSQAI